MLGDQIVLVELELVNEVLAAVLIQQLPQHDEAHPLLDAAFLQGVEGHIVLQITHTVGNDPQGFALGVDGHFRHANSVQKLGVLFGENVALVKEHFAGGGVRHGIEQLISGDALPQRELFVEFIPAHYREVVSPGVEKQVVYQGFGGFYRRRLAGPEAAVDFQHGVLVILAGVLLQGRHNAGVVAKLVQNFLVGFEAQGADEAGDGNFPVFVDADPE